MTPRVIKYARILRIFGYLAVVGFAFLAIAAGSAEDVEVDWQPMPYETAVTDLIADNGCWTGEGPADVIPGHSVVDVGNGPELALSDVGFGIWLDGDPGKVYAFCP